MSIIEHQRPGVYSVYNTSSVNVGKSGGSVGLVAICNAGEMGKVYELNSYEEGRELFTEQEPITKLIRLSFRNGAARVYAAPVADSAGYAEAFGALSGYEDIRVVACDATDLKIQQALRDQVREDSAARRERLGVICGGTGETAAQLVERADAINCERMVVVSSGGPEAAAALAGAIAGETDPAIPLGGIELKDITDLGKKWTDSEIDTLVLGGVTPLEMNGGVTSVIRAVTTRTKTNNVTDPTWRELTTIRVVDSVIPDLRDALRLRFSRAKNTPQGREAIRSQVIVELEKKLGQEIITGYDNVKVSAMEDKPTVCLVEFQFTVAHGLNQIWLSAQITV